MGDRDPCSIRGAKHLSRCVTSHPGQLSLAIPSVTFCGWDVKARKVRVRVAGVIPLLHMGHIFERFRDAS